MDNTKGIGKPPHDTPSLSKGKNYILAIGIDQYKKSPLANCVKDTENILAELTTRYAFDEKHITILFNENATRPNILSAFKSLKEKVTPNDNLLIYFSGHGFTEDNLGFWIPVNADTKDEAEWVSVSDIRDRLNRIKSLHTLLIVDACFAGSLFVTGSKGDIEITTSKSETLNSRIGITSSHSRERAYDGKAGENSPFAACLLDALKENKGSLATSSLYTQIKSRVERKTNNRQTPLFRPLDVSGDDLGEFYFHVRPNELGDWQAAKAENTEESYSHYLQKYPDGQFANEAKEILEKLKGSPEERAYKAAMKTQSILLLEKFLRDFTQKDYKASVRTLLKEKRAEAKWEKMKNSRHYEDFDEFVDDFPDSSFATIARQKMVDWQFVDDETERLRLEKEEKYRQAKAEKAEADRRERERLAKIEADKKEQERQYQAELKRQQEETAKGKREAAEKDRQKQALLKRLEPEMVLVKGGNFTREKQKVTLSDFYIGKYPITQKQWQAIMGNNPSHFKGDDLPVENVSWVDCQAFIKRINEKTGKVYRLPTEAEWEFAARGRGGNQFEYSGSNNIDEVAWYWENSDSKTHPVGTKKANELGIHDMSGNVWEWCHDWYEDYGNTHVTNPKGAETGSTRVDRGGGWYDYAHYCGVAYRACDSPTFCCNSLGFRLGSSLQ